MAVHRNETVEIVQAPSSADRTDVFAGLSCVDRSDFYHHKIHYHYFYELELCLEGSGIYEINNRTYPLQPGMLYLVTPADFHQYRLEDDRPMRYFNVQIPADALAEQVNYALYSQTEPIALLLDEAEREQFSDRLAYMAAVCEQKPELSALLLRNEAESVCIRLLQLLSGRREEEVRDDVIRSAVIYIKDHYRQPISLEEIAAHVGLSKCYFSSYFAEVMKISFSNYVRNFRLNVAANLIKSTTMTLSEIAYAAGFQTFSYFSVQFRRCFQLSPREYQRRYRPAASHLRQSHHL